jgi:hypothetical protein
MYDPALDRDSKTLPSKTISSSKNFEGQKKSPKIELEERYFFSRVRGAQCTRLTIHAFCQGMHPQFTKFPFF